MLFLIIQLVSCVTKRYPEILFRYYHCASIDRNEYDVMRLKYLTYKMSSVRACACVCACICVHACAVEIKPGFCVLCASMVYALGQSYGLPYKMATFHSDFSIVTSQFALTPTTHNPPNCMICLILLDQPLYITMVVHRA